MDPIRRLRHHWRPAAVAALLMLATVAWYAWPSSTSAAEAILTAPVKTGEFKVLVTTTGELRARKFVQVSGPATAQSVQVYQTKIASIVPEGSVVKVGDVIAELDKQPVATKIADVTLTLQKELAREQAKYEAPTIKRQAEIDYEKAQRALEQSKRNLLTKTKQAVAKMSS